MSYRYVGSELERFAAAANWKSYVADRLGRFIAGRVLEVGAGLAANTPHLHNPRVREWVCLEPDPDLAAGITGRIAAGDLPHGCRVVAGTIADAATELPFDTILYLDVLEHIAEDRGELARAARLLAPGGVLVVLAPAHQFLFSRFDAAIGHYRRYTLAELQALDPPGCRFEQGLMLDGAGLFASLANRIWLAAALPSPRQIAFWDRRLVPLSRILDRVTRYRFGKTAVAVWRLTLSQSDSG